jgi:hypothetical protein
MIVFELICADRHRFEGWFASAEDFERHKAGGLLCCPSCGDADVEKLLTAKIGRADRAAPEAVQPPAAAEKVPGRLRELIDAILLGTEDVGKEFPAEARRIHRKEAPERGIRGVATGEETRDLLEEGIAVMPLPIPPREDWH